MCREEARRGLQGLSGFLQVASEHTCPSVRLSVHGHLSRACTGFISQFHSFLFFPVLWSIRQGCPRNVTFLLSRSCPKAPLVCPLCPTSPAWLSRGKHSTLQPSPAAPSPHCNRAPSQKPLDPALGHTAGWSHNSFKGQVYT